MMVSFHDSQMARRRAGHALRIAGKAVRQAAGQGLARPPIVCCLRVGASDTIPGPPLGDKRNRMRQSP